MSEELNNLECNAPNWGESGPTATDELLRIMRERDEALDALATIYKAGDEPDGCYILMDLVRIAETILRKHGRLP
jgi:hypothetical protein